MRLPSKPGASYALRLAVGEQRYWSWITTTEPAAPLADQVVEIPPCPQGPSAAQLSVDPPAGRSGDKLTVSLTNTGNSCLTGGFDYGWERQLPDGSWERVIPTPSGFSAPAIGIYVAPGRTFTQAAFVWPELDPGPHRLTKTMSGLGEELTFSAPFEVLP